MIPLDKIKKVKRLDISRRRRKVFSNAVVNALTKSLAILEGLAVFVDPSFIPLLKPPRRLGRNRKLKWKGK